MIGRRGTRVFRRGRRAFVAVGMIAATASGCTDWAGYDLDYILGSTPILATMRTAVSYEAQELPRLPVEGTVPVSSGSGEILPAFTQLQLDSVGAVLTNPLEVTPELLARGQQMYRNQCFVCHGAQGEGNGPIVGPGRFPMGPSLVSGTALTRSEGYIYGIIRVGRGLMPSYADRISHNDRWAIVAYVEQLQQQAGGAPAPAVAQAAAGQ